MSVNLVVIYEAPADFTTATELADRVLNSEIDWLDESLLDSQRQWIGEHPLDGRLTWKSIPKRAHALGIRVRGHFDDQPGLPGAQAARRAMAYVRRLFQHVDAILLIRDQDGQEERLQGLQQARTVYSPIVRVIIGLANPERECWVISGFDAENDDERQKLATETQKLGSNPCYRSHELTACKDDDALRSPKRVLAALTASDWERQRKCWQKTPLSELIERGTSNGLTDYLNEIEILLCPIIAGFNQSGSD